MLEYIYTLFLAGTLMLWGYDACMVIVHYGNGETIEMFHSMAWMLFHAMLFQLIRGDFD